MSWPIYVIAKSRILFYQRTNEVPIHCIFPCPSRIFICCYLGPQAKYGTLGQSLGTTGERNKDIVPANLMFLFITLGILWSYTIGKQ